MLAVILAAVTIPAHALALRGPWPPAPTSPSHHAGPGTVPVARSRPFVLLAAAFALSAFAMYTVLIALIPLLTERGAGTTIAAWALGLGGAGQTLGRTLYAALARHTNATTRTAALIAAGGATTAALAVTPGPMALLTALAIAAGMVRGNLTLLQATAITDRWGTAHYGPLRPPLRPTDSTRHDRRRARPVRGRRPRPIPGRLPATLPRAGRVVRAGCHARARHGRQQQPEPPAWDRPAAAWSDGPHGNRPKCVDLSPITSKCAP